jgi:hypothetical protein
MTIDPASSSISPPPPRYFPSPASSPPPSPPLSPSLLSPLSTFASLHPYALATTKKGSGKLATQRPERIVMDHPAPRWLYMTWMTAVPIAPKRHRTRLNWIHVSRGKSRFK